MKLLSFVPRGGLFAALFVVFGAFVWGFVKEQFFTKPCPACVCPECPPQTVLYINNEKIKAKNGGAIDLKSIIQDNQFTAIDSTKRDSVKRRKGLLKRIFEK